VNPTIKSSATSYYEGTLFSRNLKGGNQLINSIPLEGGVPLQLNLSCQYHYTIISDYHTLITSQTGAVEMVF